MDTSIEARFEGHEIIEAGTAQIPNLLIWFYDALGLKDGHYVLISHVLSRKWTREAPYPTIGGIRMSANEDTRRRYTRELRQAGLLFTRRLYWTNDDLNDPKKAAYAKPGRLRANAWYLGSLLHNLVRVKQWIEQGAQGDFCIEIPLQTVQMFLEGAFHDVPKSVAEAIKMQTQNGKKVQAVLLCENDIVGPTLRKAQSRPTVRKASSRISSTRNSHTHEEESDSHEESNKNKNDENDSSDSDGLDKVFGPKQEQLADYDLPDGHQVHVDEALADSRDIDPVEEVAKHLGWGIMGEGWELPAGKRYRKIWLDAGKKLLALTSNQDWQGVCRAVDEWFEWTPESDIWTKNNADKPHKPVDRIARYYNRRKNQPSTPAPMLEIEVEPVEVSELDLLWEQVISQLKVYNLAWIEDTRLVELNGKAVVAAKNEMARMLLANRLHKPISQHLNYLLGEDIPIEYIVQ